jgi:c(7)-type cytochrome triheme protein
MKLRALLILLSLAMFAASALAVPAGKILEFPDGDTGKVTFSGQTHKDAKLVCKDCHKPELFAEKKKGTVKITMKEIDAGKQCGACHNGKAAFASKDNCGRCHKK